MCKEGKGKCVSGIYDKRVYFFKVLKMLRRDLALENLQALTNDLTVTLKSYFDSINHCYTETNKIFRCEHARFHMNFIDNLKALEHEMVVTCDDTEGFRFFVYKSLVNYLLHANLIREELKLQALVNVF